MANLFLSSRLHGWLWFLEWKTVSMLAAAVSLANPLLVGFAQLVELSGLVLLFNRRFSQIALVCMTMLHLGIVVSSGIFFWKWVVVDLLVATLVYKLRDADAAVIFGKRQGAISLALIVCAPLLFPTLKLTWFDTRLNYDYDIEVTTTDGQHYEVGRLFLSPYNLQFTQNSFWFLEEEDVVTTYYGNVKQPGHLKLLEELLDNAESDQLEARVEQLKVRIGQSRYDPEKTERLREFLRVFFTNVNRRGRQGQVIPMIPAPHHIISYPSVDEPFDFQAEIESVQMWRNISYIKQRPIQIRRDLLVDETL